MNNIKKCSGCKEKLDISYFNKNNTKADGLASNCKQCSNIISKQHYIKNKEKILKRTYIRNKKIILENKTKLKLIKESAKCKFCKEKDPCCLDFHHLSDKKFNIGNISQRSYSWSMIQKEIDKCIIVCANCHRKLHFKNER